jgi:hypothetical protein
MLDCSMLIDTDRPASQCAMPAFEGLLDDKNNAILMDLLFELATWHALAKLRLHTTSTLDALENSTARLGSILRKFASTTCEEFVTRELASEQAARGRRKAAKTKKKGTTDNSSSKKAQEEKRSSLKGPVHQRKLGLSSYKLHALGDYPKAIRMFGTTDGISSQIVRL